MPQKIAMISYHTCPLASVEGKETGGMNVYVLQLSRQLAALGYHIDMFTRCHDVDNCTVTQVEPNLRLMHLPSAPVDGSVSKQDLIHYLDEFVANFLAFTTAEDIEYDVFHCHYYLSGLVGLKLRDKYPALSPLVMTFHTLALMKNLVARSEQEQETQERIEAEYQLGQAVDKIIVPSESAKQYLASLYETPDEKITVVPPGYNRAVFRPIDKERARCKIGADATHKILLFVGRIEPLKGIDVLMYALKILTHKHPEWTICLWVLGGDITQRMSDRSPELRRLEQLRKTLHLDNVVKFVGQKPQEELPYYYNAAEVVVMPSNYESFGMAAMESMACGVPVIITNVSGISTLMDEQQRALVTSAHHPLLLAARIEELLVDDEMHHQLGQSLHQQVQHLAWEKIANQIAAIYQTT